MGLRLASVLTLRRIPSPANQAPISVRGFSAAKRIFFIATYAAERRVCLVGSESAVQKPASPEGDTSQKRATKNQNQTQTMSTKPTTKKDDYTIVSGEGTGPGTIRKITVTLLGLKRVMTAEHCHGDRWVQAYYGHSDNPKGDGLEPVRFGA
jgi:hypothetical protein